MLTVNGSKPDFVFEDHGSIWLVRPMNDAAMDHLNDNVGDEAQWFGDALAVEPRYAKDIAYYVEEAGYTVKVNAL